MSSPVRSQVATYIAGLENDNINGNHFVTEVALLGFCIWSWRETGTVIAWLQSRIKGKFWASKEKLKPYDKQTNKADFWRKFGLVNYKIQKNKRNIKKEPKLSVYLNRTDLE
jgi:hypothetical protein